MLDLPYPGGPKVDKLAKEGKAVYPLPKVHTDDPLNFSFSGLKSAVLQSIKRCERNGEEVNVPDMCASFQEAALGHLWSRVESALNEYDVKQLVLAGGVAANSRLREMCIENMKKHPDVSYIIPPIAYCTDNAAMIGASGYQAYLKGIRADLFAEADASLEM